MPNGKPNAVYINKAKCVLLGDQGVGKTSIVTRFTNDIFVMSYEATIGIDFLSKTTVVDDKYLRLQLWDTAGQERFKSLIPSYIRDSSVAIVVYDITARNTFESVDQWLDEIRLLRQEKTITFLVGNKVDLIEDRVVSRREVEEKAENEGIHFFETSAKTGQNIEKLFQKISEEIVKAEKSKPMQNGDAVHIDGSLVPQEKRRWRCWCFN